MFTVVKILFVTVFVATNGHITLEQCLDCICDGRKDCGVTVPFWEDANRPGRTYDDCMNKYSRCPKVAMETYFIYNQKDCNGDSWVDCYDYARIHRFGPNGCIGASKEIMATYDRCIDINADYKLEQCLDCICEGKYDCSITKPFWQDGGSHGGNYEMCIKFTNDWCAKATMKQYYHRFKKDCDADGFVTCHDFARIHKYGPQGCTSATDEAMKSVDNCIKTLNKE